jgi:hypothetical protein
MLGERALAPAEHLIARSKLRDVPADRFNLPGHIKSRHVVPRPGQPGHHPQDVGRARDGRLVDAERPQKRQRLAPCGSRRPTPNAVWNVKR